jgi:ribose 1,5-bisphosphate isomerase
MTIQEKTENITLPPLPNKAKEIVRSFESGEILGASRTIRLINEVFCLLADDDTASSGKELADHIHQAASYFIATRGKLSPAVGNAIKVVLRDFDEVAISHNNDEIKKFIHQQTEKYNQTSINNVNLIASHCANLLRGKNRILAYDYSSTMVAALKQTSKTNITLDVVIPESRTLDGGRPILNDIIEDCHQIIYIADSAIGQEIQRCEAVIVGVESLCVDGGFWNTVGTKMIAVLANYYNVPFYVATELIKVDPRSIRGIIRDVNRENIKCFNQLLTIPNSSKISIQCDDLEYTPPGLITNYITEEGIIPPSAIIGFVKIYL